MNIKVTTHIDAPPSAVFEALTDLEHAPERLSGVTRLEVLGDGSVGVGTRFRETRVMMKREATEEMQITAFEPGRGYTVECDSCGCHYRSDIRIEPVNGGTRVEMQMIGRPQTLGARLMAPLGLLMAGQMRKCLEQDLEDIKQSVEQSVPA